MTSVFERLKELLFKNTKRTRHGFFDGATQKECEENMNAGVPFIQSVPCKDNRKKEE